MSPFGDLFADKSRGLLMGNRGGRLHDDQRKLTARRWTSKQWICCKLDFNNRHRKVWGDSYTELFFLDEVTAFAAGHRPCFECRRKDAERFATLFSTVAPHSAHSRTRVQPSAGPSTGSGGDPALGPRLRGDERVNVARLSAAEIDKILHTERLAGKAKRLHRCAIDDLPDGAMIARDGEAFALKGDSLLRWTPHGYDARERRPAGIGVDALTPPSTLAVLRRGYAPLWHRSAEDLT
ncbi:MAG TPA: hypothetical protein VG986_17245 [Pseudolabrys sp.]|nr:hypothetical protein [Pseudolabrys sp.]